MSCLWLSPDRFCLCHRWSHPRSVQVDGKSSGSWQMLKVPLSSISRMQTCNVYGARSNPCWGNDMGTVLSSLPSQYFCITSFTTVWLSSPCPLLILAMVQTYSVSGEPGGTRILTSARPLCIGIGLTVYSTCFTRPVETSQRNISPPSVTILTRWC